MVLVHITSTVDCIPMEKIQQNKIMSAKLNIIFKAEHKFGPTDTIRAAIRRYNGKNLSDDEIEGLTVEFNKLNSKPTPRVGDIYYIPVIVMPKAKISEIEKVILPDDTLANIKATVIEDPTQFRGDLLPLLFRDYPKHYASLSSIWKNVNFKLYLDRIIAGAKQTAWPKDNLDELLAFRELAYGQFRGERLPLLHTAYPFHYNELERTWNTPGFNVYLNRIIASARTSWPEENLNELLEFKRLAIIV
jgi:hypothetical protein